MTNAQLRRLVLGHAGVVESQHQGHPDFRVGGKIVVNLDETARTMTVKLPLDQQALLVSVLPEHTVSLPGGWAKHGWTTFSLERAPTQLIRELVEGVVTAAGGRKRH
jgi:hypothetical protein